MTTESKNKIEIIINKNKIYFKIIDNIPALIDVIVSFNAYPWLSFDLR